MQEVHIFLHDQSRSDRIQELEYTRNKEYESCDESAETPHTFYYVSHVTFC